jgi:hypothetical protein
MRPVYYIDFYAVEENGELGELLDREVYTTVNGVYERLEELDDKNISLTLAYSKQEFNSKIEEGLAHGDEHLLDFFYEDGDGRIYATVESELVEDGFFGD